MAGAQQTIGSTSSGEAFASDEAERRATHFELGLRLTTARFPCAGNGGSVRMSPAHTIYIGYLNVVQHVRNGPTIAVSQSKQIERIVKRTVFMFSESECLS